MYRKITTDLDRWFKQADRKPLIIRGARQVGKTWIVRDFAKQSNLKLLEINFERDVKARNLFVDNDPQKTIMQLEIFFNCRINPKEIILFLDEIQGAKELFPKLRWFAEELPELAIIATGSLLDFMLREHESSMPVGRIQYLYLEPMSFEEFLSALGQDKLLDFLSSYQISEKIPDILHERLQQFIREYVFVGGLPAVVKNWAQNQSFLQVGERQQNIITTYKDDFAKYAKQAVHERLDEVFSGIPRLLSKKFKYSAINKDLQSVMLKNALNLLCRARICHKIHVCAGNGIPLEAEIKETAFKVIMLDVGLASAAMGIISPIIKLDDSRLANEGGIAEQLVGQLLRATFPKFVDPKLYYWMREKVGAEAEIDYLLQRNTEIIPVEVKAGSTGSLRSLHGFMEQKKLSKAVRVNSGYPSLTEVTIKNSNNQTINYQLLSLPFYLTEQIYRLYDDMCNL